ncbi:DsbA family protein [Loktanella agnita]|uniref:DsbA family protein n=1 Tax=Loktanella agnita TaxID=287097 RepID=UPI003985E495
MKRRTLLTAGGGALVALGAGWMISRPDAPNPLLPGAANAQAAEGTLPQITDMVQGNPDAAVEVIEYASFTCPHCASFHANAYQSLKANYIDTNKIRFVYREVYFDRPGLWASMIARCAETPEFFFGFAGLLYEKQREWLASGDPAGVIDALRTMGKTAGLSDADLDACLSDAAKAEALYTWYQDNAAQDGVNSTPSFMINGEKYSNMAYDEFASVLDEKLS